MPLLSGVAYYMYYFPYLSFLLGVSLFTGLQLAVVVMLMVVKYIFFVLFQEASSLGGDDDISSPAGLARQRLEGGVYAPHRVSSRTTNGSNGGGGAPGPRARTDFSLAPAGTSRGSATVAPRGLGARVATRTAAAPSNVRGSVLGRLTRTAPAPAALTAPTAPSTATDESSRADTAQEEEDEAAMLRAERRRREEESRRRRLRRRQALLSTNLTQEGGQ